MACCGPTASKPTHWNDITQAEKFYSGIKELRNRHLHMSGSYDCSGLLGTLIPPVADLGLTPRLENNLRRQFYYEGYKLVYNGLIKSSQFLYGMWCSSDE